MFVSTIHPGSDVAFDILQGGDEYIVRLPIGYDPDDDRVYSLIVTLAPLAGYADVPGYELAFQIIDAAIDETDVIPHWDGMTTRRFLADPDLRQHVRRLIYAATGMLIDNVNPNLVSMTTHTANLPRSALTKFSGICAVFRSKGFIAGKSDVWHGRHTWMMYRT